MFLQRFGNCYIIQNKFISTTFTKSKKKEISGAVIFEIVEAEAKDYHWGKIRILSLSIFFQFNNGSSQDFQDT